MSDTALPKEQLTAYERWELPNLGSNKMGKTGSRGHVNNADFALPTAAELAEVQRQAHEEGYQTGLTEGRQRIETLLITMAEAMQQADQDIAQELLNMSLEIARQMLQQALKVHPELLLSTIRAAIASLPHFQKGAHLVLHPDDAEIVRTGMGEQLHHSGWHIFEDAQIARGGARVETSQSQIDATLDSRWQRIVAAIGQDDSWIQK